MLSISSLPLRVEAFGGERNNEASQKKAICRLHVDMCLDETL